MDRFVAMVWDAAREAKPRQIHLWSDELRRRSPRWITVLDAPGLRILSLANDDAAQVTRLDDNSGIVLGTLFERDAEEYGRVSKLGRLQTRRVHETGGAALVKGYWGKYVAFWHDTNRRRVWVLRDPSGAVPCLLTDVQGILLLFAHPDDVTQLLGVRFTIDWTFLRAFIQFNYFVTSHTGFEQVKEVLSGQRLEITSAKPTGADWLWNGARLAAEPHRMTFADTAATFRAATERCVGAWANEHKIIVASLSGGLDSSILINLVRQCSTAHVVGIHYVGIGRERLEAKFARLAAQRAGVELIEVQLDPAADDVRRILDGPMLARPKVQSLAVLIDDLCVRAAQRADAKCFMIGQGGDNLFLQRGGAKQLLTDYVRLNGLGRNLIGVSYDAAILGQTSIWAAFSDAAKGISGADTWAPFAELEEDRWRRNTPISVDLLRTLPNDYTHHPWLLERVGLAPGKASHLKSIIALYNYYLDHLRGITHEVLYPFVSQPLIELALRTPIYLLCHGGLDRALERQAFSDVIPEEIRGRTSKGGASHYSLGVLRHNIDFYRSLILDGVIVKQGWFERSKLEQMLTARYATHGGGAMFIKLLVAAEAWLVASTRHSRETVAREYI